MENKAMNQLERNIDALQSDVTTFVEKYGDARIERINQGVINWLNKLDADTPPSIEDGIREMAARSLWMLYEGYHEKRTKGWIATAEKVWTDGELWKGPKWRLQNEVYSISHETLVLAWEDQYDLDGKGAQQTFGTTHPDIEFGQRRVIVSEHPLPTSVVKTMCLREVFTNWKDCAAWWLKRNIISCTTCFEDVALSQNHHTSVPDFTNPFSRYDLCGIKTYTLARQDLINFKGTRLHWKKLRKEVQSAKKSGTTFVEWASAMIIA